MSRFTSLKSCLQFHQDGVPQELEVLYVGTLNVDIGSGDQEVRCVRIRCREAHTGASSSARLQYIGQCMCNASLQSYSALYPLGGLEAASRQVWVRSRLL